MAAVRASFAVPAAVETLASPPPVEEEPGIAPRAAQDRARPALRVRRPTSAAAASQPPPPAAAPQQPAPPQQPAAPPAFMFGTPGAGPTGSAVKARRAKGRSPAGAAAPSPAFTTSSAASMAWSPYPSSTDGASAATPQAPGSATPTSGAAPSAAAAAASESPVDSVAADLRARLNLESRGGAAAAQQSAGLQPPAGPQGEPRPAADQQTAAPPPPSRPAPFSFVFGAAASAPSAHAGRAAFRRQSPSTSPGGAKTSPRAFAAAVAASAAASGASQFGSQSSAASDSSTAAFPAASTAGTSSAAAPEQQAAAGAFVFGAAAVAGSPAARMRPRSRSHSVSPQQPAQASSWGAAGAAAAAAAAAMPAFEPMQENHQQQAQQPPAAPQQGVFAAKQPAAGSPTAFTAAGTAARRPPGSRRKPAHPARSSTGMGTRSRQGSQEHEAAPPLAAAGPAAPAAAAVATQPQSASSAGSGELDAQAKMAYTSSEMYRSQGNEAFRDSDYVAAYELYTKALQALWPYPPLHPRLALLLSNRAAALLSQGKPLSALADCQMGLKYDPSLMRCALRVATCHSRMGNFDEAFQFVAKLRTVAAGNAEQLKEIESKQRDLEEQERQLYEALRSLGHNLSAPRRDPATGAEAEPLSRAASGASMPRAASGASMSHASSSASVAGGAVPQAPATAEAFWEALKKVDDIAPHVPHSELLLAAKAEGLLRLGKHERAREFCGQAVHLDEGPHREAQKRALWRLWVQAQCSWQEGDAQGGLKAQLQALLAALEAQQAQQDASSAPSSSAAAAAAGSAFFPAPSSSSSAGTSVAARQEARRAQQLGVIVGLPGCEDVRSLLEGLEAADKLRLAGNAAVKAGKAAEAVAKYSEALQASGLSPAIMAVLLSNRAAAHQHLKQRAQAIADCCRAIALNPHYAKAHSRLATLLSELGYHSDAASALEAAADAPALSSADRKEYRSRMASEQAAAKRAGSRRGLGTSPAALDHYKLLGLERSVTSDEVRRTYKKLALQLHPDKAASAVRLAPRCAGCGSAPFEALAAQGRLQERATWLFKLLGEANDVLSDASKRRELDAALRTASGGSGFSGRGGFGSYSGYGDSDDDISDIFNSMFGSRRTAGTGSGFGGSTRGGYGSGGFGSYGPARGAGSGASQYGRSYPWGYY